MNFDTNVDKIFDISKKAHAVVMSCKNQYHLEGAINYVNIVENFYTNIKCTDNMQRSYLVKSIENIRKVLKIQTRKLRTV